MEKKDPTKAVYGILAHVEEKRKKLASEPVLKTKLEHGEMALLVLARAKTDVLQILGHDDIYIIDGKFNITPTINLRDRLCSEALKRGVED